MRPLFLLLLVGCSPVVQGEADCFNTGNVTWQAYDQGLDDGGNACVNDAGYDDDANLYYSEDVAPAELRQCYVVGFEHGYSYCHGAEQ